MAELTNSMETTPADPTFHRVINCMEQIRLKLDSQEDDVLFLSNYFQSKDFRKLFKVRTAMAYSLDGGISQDAERGTAIELTRQVLKSFRPYTPVSKEAQELKHIIKKPHFQGLLQAHDFIAKGQFPSNITDEKGSRMFMMNSSEKLEAGDDEHTISVENVKTEETENRSRKDDCNGNDDTSVNEEYYENDDGGEGKDDDDDVDDDDDDDDYDVENENYDDEGSGKQTEVGEENVSDEMKDASDDNALDADSFSKDTNLDNKHNSVLTVRVQGTDSANPENFNSDPLRWDMSTPYTETAEKLDTFSAHVVNLNDVSEVRGATTEDEENVIPADIKEEECTEAKDENLLNGVKSRENEVEFQENGEEKAVKDGHKSEVVTRQKLGLPVLSRFDSAAKTIRLFRNAKETLGITVKVVKETENSERIIVARILSGGLAHTFGTLHVNDEILEINGRRVEGMTANEVADLMDGITGSVDIKIVPLRNDRKLTRETKVSLRAFFDYNPLQDPLIPCKEVGIAFSTGDILHVVNMEDAKWWQARKDGCSHDKAGLIPSKDFQEKRQQFKTISPSSDINVHQDKNGKRTLPFWRKRKNDLNKVLCNFVEEVKMDGWPVYEPVAKYLETSEKRRLLLLIGASGVGRNELKKMLLASNPDKFVTTVPHTSRHMRSYETDGREYFFVSRQTMETFISKKKFIEFGEYKGCLYGTSKDSIKRALKTGKTCVLKVQPEVMLLLRTAEFKPYCIFIKPPPLKELRTSRLTVQQAGKAERPSNRTNMRTFKEEDLQEMLRASKELEDNYGKFFDLAVVNKDTEEAYNNIIEVVEGLEREEQWVPRDWVQ
ncbi:MAGUK p55 subfamily member 4-like [Porites lutea]|uniref:MAGUK p55 subfamily member 4-like n=1 Tax=Porites lutea TaxID=51062 RepID=UPI003CC568E1